MTPEEFANKLKTLGDKIPEIVTIAISAGIDEIDAHISNRIFNTNEDVDGNSFGKYKSEAYKKFRKSLGRDIGQKDLQLFGNLKKSFQKNYPKHQLEFNTLKFAEIAEGQEKQMKKQIFEASIEEKSIALQVIEDVFYEQINLAV